MPAAVSRQTEVARRNDADPPFAYLPTEVILEVAQYLPLRDLKKLVHVSRQLRHIIGPFVYRNQRAAHVDHLVKVKVLSEQQDVARMIL
jgi:hypothetical protein